MIRLIAVLIFISTQPSYAWDVSKKKMEQIKADTRYWCEVKQYIFTGKKHYYIEGIGCLDEEQLKRYLRGSK